jgi:L,D-transpeptidase YcbB
MTFNLLNQRIMKTRFKSIFFFNVNKKIISLSGLATLFLLGFSPSIKAAVLNPDTSLTTVIRVQLKSFKNGAELYYPNAVFHFYRQNGFQPVWVKPQADSRQTWEAMLMLDCVLQFGLSHDNYHPKELVYDRLHTILEQPGQVNVNEKARYDIVLTDALITFINDLHYGKLNPEYSARRIDAGPLRGFNADDLLANAISQKNLMRAVLNAQPKTKEYSDLQYELHLIEGVHQGDCYEVPEATIRNIAINMERLRWAAADDNNDRYIQINVPSYSLKFHQPDTTFEFKVVVGKPSTRTPIIQSAITYFTTASDWKVTSKSTADGIYYRDRHNIGDRDAIGTIYFWFVNKYGISLKGVRQKQLFKKQGRALSNGNIEVERGEQLAGLLLKQDGDQNKIKALHNTINAFQVQNFILKKAVPVKITYLTCEMKDGILVTYKDIYNLDKQLEMALYNAKSPLAMR